MTAPVLGLAGLLSYYRKIKLKLVSFTRAFHVRHEAIDKVNLSSILDPKLCIRLRIHHILHMRPLSVVSSRRALKNIRYQIIKHNANRVIIRHLKHNAPQSAELRIKSSKRHVKPHVSSRRGVLKDLLHHPLAGWCEARRRYGTGRCDRDVVPRIRLVAAVPPGDGLEEEDGRSRVLGGDLEGPAGIRACCGAGEGAGVGRRVRSFGRVSGYY